MQWGSIVRGLGFAGVGAVEPEGPHVDDLRERLEVERIWVGGADCRWPAAGAVRKAVAACVVRHRAPVLVGVRGRSARCFVDGSWVGPVGYDEP